MITVRNKKKFDDSNFDIESYFFRQCEVVVGNKIRDINFFVCMFYHTVHHFLARVQSPTCPTNKKCLQENIMAMLTPKLGIRSNS